ncbi:AAEL010827-PA [Aedes aegypti]|uniref:AAEL010827-PA n=2 Tax=Aedes aegypti TaxID=7159 RepID=A0A1S4FRE3_AEDAE|nr:protein RRP5 homolog [Aedes aegypti]EAT37161.1 AAEL010827-PA [Aedes aegypti]
MVYVEPSFPRGRKVETDDDHKPRKKLKKSVEYGASTAKDEKAHKHRPKERQQALLEQMEQDKEELEQSVSAAPLQFRTAQEGMLLMGCVYKITKMDIKVSLPGRLYGTVPIMAISEAYNNRLHSLVQKSLGGPEEQCPGLEELYHEGDLVYVKIKSKHSEKNHFGLTLDPQDLHSELTCKHLVEGLVLSATVEEEEDHGYQMNVGIRNVRAFLPTHNVRNNKMIVGRNLFCSVEKVTHGNGSATVVLRAFKPTEPRKLEVAQPNVDSLVPGSVVTFTVESVLQNGLQGSLFDDTVPAFVNENMLEKPLSSLKQYELFKEIPARVLYVMPLTKHVFVTLAHFDGNRASVADPVTPGKIIQDAKIIHKSLNGVWFQIGKKHKALLPKYILKSKYNQNYDEQIVMAKYQVGSVHTVRVMRFEAFDRTIIVTDDEEKIETKYFTLNDLKVGDIYNCRITKVLDKKRGFLVSLDNLKGIVTAYNFEPSKTYAANQMAKLRLIGIDEDRKMAQFTNHPEYLKKSAKLLTSREDVKQGQRFLGTVISEQEKFFIVAFCNKITAICFKFCRAVTQDQNRISRLKPGVVDRFTVNEVSEDGSRFTVVIPLDAESENLGHIVSGTITGIYATGADIYLVKENATGTVPPELFSDFPPHNALYASVLKEGEQLRVVNVKENVYSCRDVEYFRRKPTEIKNVKLGQVLRAYCVGMVPNEKKICFRLALKDYHRNVVLKMSEFADSKEGVSAEVGQVILVKVVKKVNKEDGVLLVVSPKLEDVCTNGVEDPIRYLQTYLCDVKELVKRFKSHDKAFAQYSVGQSVTCVVESFIPDSDQMVVRLGDVEDTTGAKGIATKDPKRDAESYSPGDLLEGRVVWVDVEKKLVRVCVVKKYLKHLVNADDENVSKELLGTEESREFVTLFQNGHIAVGCLPKVDSPLVIVPVRCHYNDLGPVKAVQGKVQVHLVRISDGLILGLTEELHEKFKNFNWAPAERKDKSGKACWLPDDYEEPLLEDPKESSDEEGADKEDADAHSNSDGDQDEEVAKPESTVQESNKKSKKKQKKKNKKATPAASGTLLKVKKTNAVESPAKALKGKKEKKKAAAKKLKAGKPFVISQLDGADDLPMMKQKKQGGKKNKKHFLSERPAANAPPNLKVKQSGSEKAQLEKKDKLHQLAQQTKFKKKKNKKNKVSQVREPITEIAKPVKTPKTVAKTGTLPGADGFWSTNTSLGKQDSDSSDDDEQPIVQTKKRLNAKERFEAMKQEEQRIRQIEDELADASVDPHTPDQFDRQVLSQPNSSLLWIRYMVFHMESAEVEKARAVARRALKTINFREEGERLNVWIALLNLELRYETVETFKEVLQEAIQYNDAFKVYSRVIEIVIDCGKTAEALDIIDILQKRFRKQPEMWLLVGSSYYKLGQAAKVKPLLSKALKSLETKEHIPLIVKFAFLHNRNGERDEAHILFEQILTSYPKRTDIWSQYVDMLVKDGLVDVARQTLDRAIAQRLPMKNMKTLYTKYVAFEEKHGDREAVKRIKQAAANYVEKQLSSSGVTV